MPIFGQAPPPGFEESKRYFLIEYSEDNFAVPMRRRPVSPDECAKYPRDGMAGHLMLIQILDASLAGAAPAPQVEQPVSAAASLDIFENDDAADFLATLQGEESIDLSESLSDAMRMAVDEQGYLELPVASTAAAAAGIVALRSGPADGVPSEIGELFDLVSFDSASQLKGLATRTFARILQEEYNEWYELWARAPGADKVRSTIERYASLLQEEAADGR
jgi:hypothetical protein